jgi:hypothetical protein
MRWWNFIKEHFVLIVNPYISCLISYAIIILLTLFICRLKNQETKAIRFNIDSIKLYFVSYFVALGFVFLITIFICPSDFIEEFFLLLVTCFRLLAWIILRPWRWRRHVPPKRRLTFNGLHGVMSQKIGLFLTTALRTSDPTNDILKKLDGFYRFYIYILGSCNVGGGSEEYLSRPSPCFNCRRIAVACRLHRASVRICLALRVSLSDPRQRADLLVKVI